MTEPRYPNSNPDVLSPTSLRILALVMSRHRKPPSIRELAKACGTTVNNIQQQVIRLCRLGLLRKEYTRARTIRAGCRFEDLSGSDVA